MAKFKVGRGRKLGNSSVGRNSNMRGNNFVPRKVQKSRFREFRERQEPERHKEWVVLELARLAKENPARIEEKLGDSLRFGLFRMFREKFSRNPESAEEIIGRLKLPGSTQEMIRRILKAR